MQQKKQNRVRRRLDRMRQARHQPVSAPRRIAAVAIFGALAVIAVYGTLVVLGSMVFQWHLAGYALALGVVIGSGVGATATAAGVPAEILAAIWVALEVTAHAIVLVLESILSFFGAILAFIAGLFSIFSS
ncbi:MAG: hypothetical protein AAGF59_15815 [Pseudomonadota bacterium]